MTYLFKKNKKLWVILGIALYAIAIFFIAFLYYRVTKFPIGDDPAVHISNIKHMSFQQLWTLNYPIPLTLFKTLNSLLHIDTPILFIILLCVFFAVASLTLSLLAYSLTHSYQIAAISGLLFSVSRWANDGLRMGLFAEVFAWIILLLAIYFLSKKQLIPTVFFTLLLTISHPFAVVVFFLFFIFYALTLLASKDSVSKQFAFKFGLVFAAIISVSLLLFKALNLKKFITFTGAGITDVSFRTLYEFFATDSRLGLFFALFAFIGILATVKDRSKNESRLILSLLATSLVLSFNQKLGVGFLVFRFFPYLEMVLVILASIGIFYLVNYFYVARFKYLLIAMFLVPIFASNYKNCKSYLNWQSKSVDTDATLSVDDREAIRWINNNTTNNFSVVAPWKTALWVPALSKNSSVPDFLEDNPTPDTNKEYDFILTHKILPEAKSETYRIVFMQGKTIVYESIK